MNAFTPPTLGQPEQLEEAPSSRRPPTQLLVGLAVVLAFIAGGVAGALVFGDETEPQPGPEAVTETYFKALVTKKSDEALEQVHIEGFTCAGAFAFGVKSYEVGDAVVDGDHARVPVELAGSTGLTNKTEFILDKFDGRWKITGPISTPPSS